MVKRTQTRIVNLRYIWTSGDKLPLTLRGCMPAILMRVQLAVGEIGLRRRNPDASGEGT